MKNIHAALAVIAFAYVVFLGFLNFSLYFCCHSFSWVSGGSIKPACRLPLLVYTITPSSVLRSWSCILLRWCCILLVSLILYLFKWFQLVFSSSATVYGWPKEVPCTEEFPLSAMNPYGRTKVGLGVFVGRWNLVLIWIAFSPSDFVDLYKISFITLEYYFLLKAIPYPSNSL